MPKAVKAKAVILVADNDSESLQLQKEALEPEGYKVVTATSPDEAQQVLEKKEVDVAVLDMRLENDDDPKDTSGLVLAKTVAPQVPKIILTKHPTYATTKQALSHGVDGPPPAHAFIDKAEGREALVEAIKNVLPASPDRAAFPFLRLSPQAALAVLLLALGTGILSVISEDPRWLLATIALATFAVFFIGQSIE